MLSLCLLFLTALHSTVAVALWAMEDKVPVHPDLQLEIDGVYDGGVGEIAVNNPGYVPRNVY